MKTNFIGCTSQKNCTDDQQSKWMHRDNLVFSALALANQAKLLARNYPDLIEDTVEGKY